jgi:hypothetical protein
VVALQFDFQKAEKIWASPDEGGAQVVLPGGGGLEYGKTVGEYWIDQAVSSNAWC